MSNAQAKRQRAERWKDIKGGMAFIIPVLLIRHPNYRLVSPWAHKLLADLSTQYSGFNNGYLCAAWTLMKERGWNSRTTLAKACAELEHYRLIERTQQGGRNRPNLYAFSWRRIDRREGRSLDIPPTAQPSDAWNATVAPFSYAPSPRRGLIKKRQAQLVDSVCPPDGLASTHKSTDWGGSSPENTLSCPLHGHLTIVTSSTGPADRDCRSEGPPAPVGSIRREQHRILAQ
jgi:hypothetical protein